MQAERMDKVYSKRVCFLLIILKLKVLNEQSLAGFKANSLLLHLIE